MDRSGNGNRTLNFPTRGRPQLSCTPCKRRKLKCDRVKRRESETCVYPVTPARDQVRESKRTKKRLDRLEALVMGLIESQNHLDGRTAIQQEQEQSLRGSLSQTIYPIESDRNRNLGNGRVSHESLLDKPSIPTSSSSTTLWESVLRDIAEIRSYFEQHERDFREQEMKPPQQPRRMRYGNAPSSLPARPAADLLIANYFGVTSHVRPVIHPKKFLREYEKFWKNPYDVSKMWLGLLFAIMRQGIRVSKANGIDLTPSVGDADEAMSLFRTRTTQCLASSDYSKPTMEQLETLAVHLEAEFTSSPDSQIHVRVLMGSVVRLAMRIGLHREPSLFPEFTPFQCEMRRRLWLAVVQSDIFMSFQVGLPAMIPKGQHDTMLPRNLREDDFDEDSTALPLSRPMNEVTKISFFIAKMPMLEVFAKTSSHILDIHPNDADVATLESELYAARDAMPPYYKMRPLEESILDPPHVVLARMGMDQTMHSGLCILHRRRLPLARSNPQFSHSRKVCVDAALTLLSYQAIHHRETAPTGRFAGYKGMATSVTTNDYLLAAMLLCLDLRLALSGPTHPASSDVSLWGMDRREEMMQALETSYHVWRDSKDTSIEAFRASEALTVMLSKVRSDAPHQAVVPSLSSEDVIIPGDNVELPYSLSQPFSEMVSSPNEINWASALEKISPSETRLRG
ncbi:hypothetical protein VTN77DRAFT_2668 [Rasamsonia byssochlamydoides]|uniref:uncharacterized protein n=1 Tax=Rasamsonia byssochlamydoides TaxID=89139 RepID=UPI00374421EE